MRNIKTTLKEARAQAMAGLLTQVVPKVLEAKEVLARELKEALERRRQNASLSPHETHDALEGALDDLPPREQGMFPAEDGTSLFYEVRGEGKPLVFCYGLTCRREHWRHQMTHFVKSYQVITFDYRGHHGSGLPENERNLTIDWCARDVRALMNHLQLDRAVCLGHSMGVPVVASAAGKEPERIKGAVLICGAVTNPFEHMFFTHHVGYVYLASAWLFENAPDTFARVWQRLTARNPLSFFLTSRFGFNTSVSEERDILMYLEGVSATPLTTFHTLLNDYVRCDGRALIEEVRCPTLVIAGAEDFITPLSVQEAMVSMLRHGELASIPGGSHNAHMDYPSVVNAKIQAFLERIDYR